MKILSFTLVLFILTACASRPPPDILLSPLERQIASRMVVSLGYYCDELPEHHTYCQQPMRDLPPALAAMLGDTAVAGIILFGSNFDSIPQTVRLTRSLQSARPQASPPLLIAVDQEGGRVARLPRHWATSFPGNMAIGATYAKHGVHYAEQAGMVIGQELSSLGINVNFAPTLDVNVNPANPVINTRSFGSDPMMVGELGVAKVAAIQASGVAAALKHFPGHGDTDIDSHTGLPRIDRPLSSLTASDLKPFQMVIDAANPAMIMTAHIQYPQVDDSTVLSKDNEQIQRPATMSKVILTDVLRTQMNFEGVVITDALDMAGISNYFDPVDAVIETFRAGADMALMPFLIDDAKDIGAFKLFIRAIAQKLNQNDQIMMQSAIERINNLRLTFTDETMSIEDQIERSKNLLANDVHRQLEVQTATEAITVLKGQDQLPWTDQMVQKVKLIAHDLGRGQLLKAAILDFWPLNNHQPIEIEIVTWREQAMSNEDEEGVIKLGLLDYSYRDRDSKLSREEQRLAKIAMVNELLAKQSKMVLVAMQSPYDLIDHLPVTDVALAAYLSTTYLDPDSQQVQGLMYRPLAAVLTGATKKRGRLPVILDLPEAEAGVASGVQ